MNDLADEIKAVLREFKNSVFFPAYREYVLTEAGKCLGQIRTSNGEGDAFTKGKMRGIEQLVFDLNADEV